MVEVEEDVEAAELGGEWRWDFLREKLWEFRRIWEKSKDLSLLGLMVLKLRFSVWREMG